MKNIKVIYEYDKEKLEEVYNQKVERLWNNKKYYLLRDFLFFYLFYWIGYFCYWFCQDGFRYYIKHFKLEVQLPIILIMVFSAIFWIYLFRTLFIEMMKREKLIEWYEDNKNILKLKQKLESIYVEDLLGFELKDNEIIMKYLTNRTFHSIIIPDKMCKLGNLYSSDTDIVVDFTNKLIYSTNG